MNQRRISKEMEKNTFIFYFILCNDRRNGECGMTIIWVKNRIRPSSHLMVLNSMVWPLWIVINSSSQTFSPWNNVKRKEKWSFVENARRFITCSNVIQQFPRPPVKRYFLWNRKQKICAKKNINYFEQCYLLHWKSEIKAKYWRTKYSKTE